MHPHSFDLKKISYCYVVSFIVIIMHLLCVPFLCIGLPLLGLFAGPGREWDWTPFVPTRNTTSLSTTKMYNSTNCVTLLQV